MNFIFLSPNFPPHYWLFCDRLKRAGAKVLAIGDAPWQDLRPELRDSLTEYYRVRNLEDLDQVYRATAFLIHNHGKIDRFESHNEHWLETDASIRTAFNIPGVKLDQVAIYKNKSRMKALFEQVGVRVARHEVAEDLAAASQAAARIGYPVVIKPDKGVGAACTFRLDSDEELRAVFAAHHCGPFIIEEFVDGRIVTFDGLTDRDRNVVFSTSHEYSHGAMDIVNKRLNHYFYSLRRIPDDLEQTGLRCVEAFDIRESFFHFEFFRCPDGSLVAIELNKRPPGGPILDMINYANNIDVYREYANVVVTNQFGSSPKRPYHSCYVGRRLDRPYVHSHEAVLSTWEHVVVHHAPVDPLSRVVMCDYGYLLRSPDLAEIEQVATFIHAPGEQNLGWVSRPETTA